MSTSESSDNVLCILDDVNVCWMMYVGCILDDVGYILDDVG